ncbi:MAG: hypothetical protein Q9195_008509 [Heterodermia aff. obscurata]
MKQAHDEYGTFVRFGPTRVLCNSNTGLRTIYTAKNVIKSKGYTTTLASDGAWHVFNVIDKKMHARKTRIIRQAVKPENLKHFEPLWLEKVQKFVDQLAPNSSQTEQPKWSTAKNVSDYALADRMSMDIMGAVGFSRQLDLQSRPDNWYIIDVMAELQKWNSTHIQSTSLAKLNLDKIFYPQQLYYGRKLLEQVRLFVEERTKKPEQEKNDIFSFIVDATDPLTGEHLPLEELWSEAKLLMVAAGDSVATTVSSVLFYVTRNVSCHQRLIQEIRDTFQNPADIHCGPVMDSCQYLQACIKEGLRMSPPTGGALWREVESEALVVDGHVFPKGYEVGTSIYAVHHNEEYFPDSYSFMPERWMEGNSFQDLETAASAWMPFSLGTRVCLGQGLAMMELSGILALLIWHLDFRLPKDNSLAKVGEGAEQATDGRHRVEEFQMKDHITSQINGPYLEFRRRIE